MYIHPRNTLSGKHLRMEKDINIMFWFSFSNCVKFVTEGDQKKNPLWKNRWILYLCRYCRKQITGRNAKVCNYVLSKPNFLNIFVKMVHVRQCWTRPVSSSPRTWGQYHRNPTALNLWKSMRITDRYLSDNKNLVPAICSATLLMSGIYANIGLIKKTSTILEQDLRESS